MISFQHMISDNDDDVIAHAARGGRGGRRTSSRRRWGFAAAGVGAAAGGVLLARNKRVRKLVSRGLKSKFARKVGGKIRKGYSKTTSYLKKSGAYKAIAPKLSQYSASIKGSKLYGSAARLKSAAGAAYGRVKASVVKSYQKAYKTSKRRSTSAARAIAGQTRRQGTRSRNAGTTYRRAKRWKATVGVTRRKK